MDPNKPVSSTDTPSYIPLMLAAIEHGILGEWYTRGLEESSSKTGTETRRLLFPIQRLDDPGVQIPRGGVYVIQGRQDSVVPAHHSEPFVARAREVAGGGNTDSQQNGKVVLVFRDGEHGFDGEERYEEGGWVQEALAAAVEAWLEVY